MASNEFSGCQLANLALGRYCAKQRFSNLRLRSKKIMECKCSILDKAFHGNGNVLFTNSL